MVGIQNYHRAFVREQLADLTLTEAPLALRPTLSSGLPIHFISNNIPSYYYH